MGRFSLLELLNNGAPAAPAIIALETLPETPGKRVTGPAFEKLKEVSSLVRDTLADTRGKSDDEITQRRELIKSCHAGDPTAIRQVKELIRQVIIEQKLSVPGVDILDLVEEIYRYHYGLDVLEPLYHDPEVEEIRVNNPEHVWVVRRGKSQRADVRFKDDYHIEKIIKRAILHDDSSITRDVPRVESTRQDGSRLTATLKPFTEHPTLVIRKHNTFLLTEESLVASGTISARGLDMLKVLVRGRANILISGATNTGKTSLLRFLVRYLHPWLRLVTLETSFELKLADYYPDRDIVAMEEQLDLKKPITLTEAFKTVLRYTPDVIIVGEARSAEAYEMVKAANRGHDGTMGTIHTSSPSEAVDAMAAMIQEQWNMDNQTLRKLVARSFDVVVQMATMPYSRRRYIQEITELYYNYDADRIEFRELMRWEPGPNGVEEGQWRYPDSVSGRLVSKLIQHGVSFDELRRAGIGGNS